MHRPSSIARSSQRLCVVSQLMCAGRRHPSQIMCVETGHLLRVWTYIIARRYTYPAASGRLGLADTGPSTMERLT